jgi:hypothetical protein
MILCMYRERFEEHMVDGWRRVLQKIEGAK